MKTFKIADCIGQAIIILAGCAYMAANGIGEFFLLYSVIGPWQLVSMFIHLVAGNYYVSYIRKLYHKLLLFTVGSGIVCIIIGGQVVFFWLTGLILVSAVLALMYLTASILETKRLIEQPLNAEVDPHQS